LDRISLTKNKLHSLDFLVEDERWQQGLKISF